MSKRNVLLFREKIKNFELLGEAVKTWALSLGAIVSVVVNIVSVFGKHHHKASKAVARSSDLITAMPSPENAAESILSNIGLANFGGLGVTLVFILLLIFWRKKGGKNVGAK